MKQYPVYPQPYGAPYYLRQGYARSGAGYYPYATSYGQQVFSAVKSGAMIGATGAVAMSLYDASQGRLDKRQVLENVARASATVGAAAGAVKAVELVFEDKPVISSLASFAAGTAVSYFLGLPGNKKAEGEVDD
ncbi:MAG: hypothetical protein CSB48_10995 [Proteobacteria bacterium]|nr:MAG: hypothetical protein CSB48_10995 [Pseudomonadota bacterium]PIE40064.1 MAG: hypothetical protein CSA51_02755 [Gammaproteobacteria bacterium]